MQKLYVSNKPESIRLFKINWMDALSKVHWTTPLLIYIPIISYLLYPAITGLTVSPWTGVGYVLLGALVWTITEYLLHRFLFHYHPTTKLGKQPHLFMSRCAPRLPQRP
ncbi:MAG: hypothetical protein AAF960_00285 [Bacteroidota bacterium]